MKIYILLPLIDEKYSAKSLEYSAELRRDYRVQFKTKTITFAKPLRYCVATLGGQSWSYTVIEPKMFEPHRKEIKR